MKIFTCKMPHVIPSQFHHVESASNVHLSFGFLFDDHVRNYVVRSPQRPLRPGVGVQHPELAHRHQVLVLGEDRRLAVPGLVRGIRRHPVDAVGCEEVDPRLPLPGVQQLGLPVEELLDVVLQIHPGPMYRAQAFIWFLIGASEVPIFGPEETSPAFSMSRPRWRPRLTQSPPSEASPWWHFQKFSRSSALISVAGELTRF